MVGLLIAIIIFNTAAFTTNRLLTPNQILHIWLFTTAFQLLFDTFIVHKFHGYWYFSEQVSWLLLLSNTMLIPPVNVVFLNLYPYKGTLLKQFIFLLFWNIGILIYEGFALLPDPWGYFHYGWWTMWHSVILNPFLLILLLFFYKWIRKLEKNSLDREYRNHL